MTQQTFAIEGMHCQACVGRVTKALLPLVFDAQSVNVDLQAKQVRIGSTKATLAQLQAAVAGAGQYVLAPLSTLPAVSSQKKSLGDRLRVYRPLVLVFFFITAGAALLTWRAMPVANLGSAFMLDFMAGFFLVFGFFKLLDLPAFAQAYQGYDLLAKRFKPWGYVYPFLEIALGVAYLMRWNLPVVHWIAMLVMWFSALGVLNALMNRRQIRCACLGSVFNLPMSTVTLVEDLLMVVMAAWMLLGK